MSGMFGDSSPMPRLKSVEWYTPAWVFEAMRTDFDLDPSSPHDHETHVPARVKYTVFDDGLSLPWFGRVWLNPPYGPRTDEWMRKMIDHRHGIAMVFSRTDSAWCQEAMSEADAVLFLSGRVAFVPGNENKHKKGRTGAGTLMLAFGRDCAFALGRLRKFGVFIDMRLRCAA